jgi:hypothetical protein
MRHNVEVTMILSMLMLMMSSAAMATTMLLVPENSIHVFKSDWAQPLHQLCVSVLQFYE